MKKVPKATAIENLGIEGDRHALPDSSRQVLLIERETLEELNLEPGAIKENITTANIGLMKLQSKQQLKIGDNVILEITKPCSPCSRMEEIRPGFIKEIAGRRGMLARVIKGGAIGEGDNIVLC